METVTASVQYGDFVGEAMADNADRDDIAALVEKFGVEGRPVAFSFYSGERGFQSVAVFTPETGSSFDDIEAQAKANGGRLRVKRHDLEGATVTELLNTFKRFHVVLRYRFPSVQVMEYESD